MRRQILVLSLTAVVGLLISAGSAQACHKMKLRHNNCAPEPVCAPAPVCEPEPVCAPEPACEPKAKCGLFARKGCGHMFKKRGCCKAEPVCAPAYYAAPVVTATYTHVYAAPQATHAAPQHEAPAAAPQTPVKSMPQIPSKQG